MPRDVPLRERARGRWKSILPQLGLPSKILNGRHQPCPVCGGDDRFRFDDKKGEGTFFCSKCGAGDGVRLVELFHGIEFREAAERVEALIGSSVQEEVKPEIPAEERRRSLNGLWRAGQQITADDPVGRYLDARTGLISFPASLRRVDKLKLIDGDDVSWRPAMIAKVTNADGSPCTIHRTFLPDEWKPGKPVQRRFSSSVNKGCAVRLCRHGEILGVGEGIETSLSAMNIFGIPVWATLNEVLLSGWIPPKTVKTVIVFGDNDSSFAGQASAFALAKRLTAMRLDVRVWISPDVDEDWNDVWRRDPSLRLDPLA